MKLAGVDDVKESGVDFDSMREVSKTPSNIRWVFVAPTLLAVWIVSMLDKSNMSIVAADPQFLNELGLTGEPAKLGLLTTALLVAFGMGAPVWGWLTTLIGPRRVTLLAVTLWAVSCVMSGLAGDYGVLLGTRIVLGFAEAALYPVTLALVASWFPLKERGRATAFWWIGTMIGPMITGLLVTWLIVKFGWREQFYAQACIALLVPLPMVWLLVCDRPQQHWLVNAAELAMIEAGAIESDNGTPGLILRREAGHWYASHRYWLVVASITFNSMFFWGWSIWLPTYLTVVRHFSFMTAGYVTFFLYGGATLTILAVGRYSDRLFRRATFALAGWLFAAVFLLAGTYVPDPTICVILMVLALCGQQIGVSAGQMLYHSIVGTADMAKSQGVAMAVILLGSFSPVMLGYFLQASPGDFSVGFIILASVACAAAGCVVPLAREGL